MFYSPWVRRSPRAVARTCKGLCLITFSILASFSLPAKAASLKLFILAGQSNMVGYGSNINSLDPNLRTFPSVLWYDPTNHWNEFNAPTEPFFFSGGVANKVGFGPEVSLANTLSKQLNGETIALVKYARNGTSLAQDWQPNGLLYTQMIARVNEAIATFPDPSITLDISGFFWMQGESDARLENWANQYESNLTNFITGIRQDLNQPNLPFILGLIPLTPTQSTDFGIFPYAETVRLAQQHVSETLPFTGWVETLDLSRDRDNLHLDSNGLIVLGDRFAQKWQPIPEPSMLGFLGLSVLILPFLRRPTHRATGDRNR